MHVLFMLGMNPIKGARVTLVTRDVDTPYSGMLPGHVAGMYSREECHIDLLRIARFANANVVHAEAVGIDIDNKVTLTTLRTPLQLRVVDTFHSSPFHTQLFFAEDSVEWSASCRIRCIVHQHWLLSENGGGHGQRLRLYSGKGERHVFPLGAVLSV